MAIGNLDNLQSLSRRSRGAKEVLVLDCDEVVAKEGQVRQKFAGIEELAKSIRTQGQEQPIIVYPKDKDGQYRIQKGERRWRACKLAGIPVEAIVNKKEQDTLDETAGELIENIQRENLTPMEIAQGLQKFIDAGWKGARIAERLSKSRGYISLHLSLLKLPECVHQLYENEVTSDPDSLNALRQIYEIDPRKAEQICERALEEGISRKACRELLKQAKKGGLPEDPEIPSTEDSAPLPGPGTNDTPPNINMPQEAGSGVERNHEPSTEEAPSSSPGKGGPTAGEKAGAGAGVDPSQESNPAAKREVLRTPADVTLTQPEPPNASVRGRVVVSVSFQAGQQSGVLLTDRIDQEAGYCWVRLDNGDEKPLRALVSDVQLLGVEGEE